MESSVHSTTDLRRQNTGRVFDLSRLSHHLYKQMNTLCQNDEVILLEKMRTVFNRDFTFHLNHICIALILRGSGEVVIDGSTYRIEKDDMFVIMQQKDATRQKLSDDFEACVLMLSRSYVDRLDIHDRYRFIMSLRENPVVHLDGKTLAALSHGMNMLGETLRETGNLFREQVIYHLIKAYIYSFAYYLLPEVPTRCREEEVCVRFMDLVESNYQAEHSVGFYAGKLNLSPRYVSACVKSQTGQTATDIIGNRLAEDAKKSLLRNDMTVSQIAYKLGFDNPSTFGRFFKSRIGVSPRKWLLQNR